MLIRVYTRQGCPLCDAGIALVHEVLSLARVELIDVDLDLELIDRYGDRVPVVEDASGTVIDEGIITKEALSAYQE